MAHVAVNLHNKARRMLVLNIPHEVCAKFSIEQMRGKVVQMTTGEKAVKPETVKLGGSITLLAKGSPGASLYGLPIEVMKAPDVQAHMADLHVEYLSAEQLKKADEQKLDKKTDDDAVEVSEDRKKRGGK